MVSDNYSSLRSSLKKINNKKLEKMMDVAELKKMSDKEVQKLLLLANVVSVDQARKILGEMTSKKEKEGKQLDEFFAAIRAENAEQKSKIDEILKEFEKKELVTAKNPDTLEVLKLGLEWREEGHELPVETRMKLEYLHSIEKFFENKKEFIIEMNSFHQELVNLNKSLKEGKMTLEEISSHLPTLNAKATKISKDSELSTAIIEHNKIKNNPAALKEILANSADKAQFEKMQQVQDKHMDIASQMKLMMQNITEIQEQNHAEFENPLKQNELSLPARSLTMKKKPQQEKELDISPAA